MSSSFALFAANTFPPKEELSSPPPSASCNSDVFVDDGDPSTRLMRSGDTDFLPKSYCPPPIEVGPSTSDEEREEIEDAPQSDGGTPQVDPDLLAKHPEYTSGRVAPPPADVSTDVEVDTHPEPCPPDVPPLNPDRRPIITKGQWVAEMAARQPHLEMNISLSAAGNGFAAVAMLSGLAKIAYDYLGYECPVLFKYTGIGAAVGMSTTGFAMGLNVAGCERELAKVRREWGDK